MKLLPVLLALCAVAFANIRTERSEWIETLLNNERSISDTKFRVNREYKFVYNGQLTTGIPGTSQLHSATRIQSLISIVFKSEDKVLLKMLQTRFGKLNEEIPEPRNIVPFEAYEFVEMEPEMEELLKKTVQFRFNSGMISSIEFDGEEKPWSANIKRGVLNLLQVNFSEDSRNERDIVSRSSSSSSSSESSEEFPEWNLEEPSRNTLKSFKVYEKTLEGECETLYTVVSNPCKETPIKKCRNTELLSYNVTKSINFEKCRLRPEVIYNERFQQICPTCEGRYNNKEKNLRSSTVIKMSLSCPRDEPTKCLIEKSSSESQYNLVPFSEEANMMSTIVRQVLELVETSDISSDIKEPRNKIFSDSDMIYTLDWDLMKEDFFLNGEESFEERTPFSKVTDKLAFMKTIIEKLLHYTRESVDEEAPRQVARLVRLLRMLKREEIEQVHQKFFKTREEFTSEEHVKVKDLLIDSIALCGTHDCISHLVSTIKSNEISNIKASMVIRKLMDVRVLNKNMIEKVMSICESTRKCHSSPQLKQAVLLTTGSMMRTLCNEKSQDKPALLSRVPSHQKYVRFCTKEIRSEFVEKMIAMFKSTESIYEKVLVLKTLSNSGLKESLIPLELIIKDKKVNPSIRIEAILSFRHLIDVVPEKIVKMLLPIYMTRSESSPVRIASFYTIMQTLPNKLVIDQLTRSLTTERRQQVAAFSYTMLQTMANSTNPCEIKMADDIKLSLRHGRYLPVNKWMKKSKFLRIIETVSRNNKMASSIDYMTVKSSSSLPHKLAVVLNLNVASMWSPKFVSIGFGQLGLSKVMNQIWRSQSHNLQSSLGELLSGKFEQPSPRFNYRSELKEMFEKLNIESERSSESFEPFGKIDLQFKNQEFAFLPLSSELSEMIPEEIREMITTRDISSINKIVKRAERLLRDMSVPFNFHTTTFIHEQSRKIPTTLGLPIRVSFKVPTVMQATGTVKVEIDEQNPLKKIKLVVKNFKPSMVATVVTKMECWSPIVNSGVKVIAQAKLFAPLEASISIDTLKSKPEIKFIVSPITKSTKEIVTIQTRPSTFTVVWPKFLRTWQEPEERTMHGTEWNRVRTHNVVVGEHAFGVKFHSRAHWHRLPTKHVPGTPISLLSGPNKYSLTMSPGHEMPKEFIMTITGNLFNKQDSKTVDTSFDKFDFTNSYEKFFSGESSEEAVDSVELNEYYKTYKGESPVNNEVVVLFKTKGSPIKRTAELKSSCLCDKDMKSCKCKLVVKRSPIPTKESKQWKLQSMIEMLYPETPMSLSEMTSDKRFVSTIETKWGSSKTLENKLNIKMIAGQSDKLLALKERSLYNRLSDNKSHRDSFRSLFSSVGQYKQTLKYGLLDEIKFDIDYKLSNDKEEYLTSIFRMLKHKYYDQTYVSVTGKKATEGRVMTKLNIDPINRRYVNLTVMTPIEQTTFIDIPMSFAVPEALNIRRVSSPSRSAYEMLSSWFSSDLPVCESRTDRIKTFDSVEMEMPTSTCFSVLAKDCSSSSSNKFAILIKKKSPSSEHKILKIVSTNTKLVIKSLDNELECRVNDEVKPCDELERITEHRNHVVLSCRKYSQSIECHLPEAGIKVFFDGFATDVKVSELYRNRVCGLCGNYDDETENELTNINYEPVDRRERLESFIVKEQDECSHEFSPRHSSVWEMFNSNEIDSDEIVPEYLDSPVRERNSVIRPVKRTMVIEQAHELCFSKTPVHKCTSNSHATEFESQKKSVVFTCFPRNSVKAEILERRVLSSRVITDLEEEVSSFTEMIKVPKMCRHFN